jgi:uncharacterized protein YbjT (DUF2867 family)
MAKVFVAGATGYMGRELSAELLRRGHTVRAVVRPGSERKLVRGCEVVHGNVLRAPSYSHAIAPADTFVQLVGVPKPNPFKGEQFRAVDRIAGLEAVRAAQTAGIRHFVYVSVAHPAPMMKDYIAVREEVEAALLDSGLNATILRPWYVLGPGHWWPYALLPLYKIAENIPSTADGAHRLGLVTLKQIVRALTFAVEERASGVRMLSVGDIREIGSDRITRRAAA